MEQEEENIEKDEDQENFDESDAQPDDGMNFIQDFIERKKLQNRILREIIENIKPTEKD